MSIIIASLIISVVGYFIQSQLYTAASMCALLLLSELLQAAAKRLKGKISEARAQLISSAGVAAVLVFTLGFAKIDQKAAYGRAEQVVAAVEKYEAEKKALPGDLSELVPHYLDSIPRAKYTLLWGTFKYSSGRLYWTATPVFAVPEYDFSVKSWGFRRPVF